MRSTFSGLNMALLGMNASQKALDVTGQNLTNINTSGYTRQRLDQTSISPTGASYFTTGYSAKAGQGVLMTGVSQIRDPFLDVQFRNQLARTGTYDAKDQVLTGIGDVFDNVDVSTVQNALDEVTKQLQTLSTKVGQDGNDNLVRSSFEVLLNYIHQNATELGRVRTDLETKMETTTEKDLNQILKSIQQLNESIKASQIQGNPALELKDQRNSLIDDLATYLPIEVKYKNVPVGTMEVETLQIRLKDKDNVYLVDDDRCAEFEFDIKDGKSDMLLNSYIKANGQTAVNPLSLKDTVTEGVLRGNLDMLNGNGVFEGDGTDVKGIGYYEKLFDSFVHTLATEMNNLNGIEYEENGVTKKGGALFETSDGSKAFTASNITISKGWMNGDVKMIPSKNAGVPGNTDAGNILKFKALLSTDKIKFYAYDEDGNRLKNGTEDILVFEGNMPAAYANIQGELGIEIKSTESILENRSAVLANSADARDSVMGVNLDEEVMNLMRYQQSYNAAARLMTAMDEILEKLINGTGTVGR